MFLHGNSSCAWKVQNLFAGKKGCSYYKKLYAAGVTKILFYDALYPWKKTGVMELDGKGGELRGDEQEDGSWVIKRKQPNETYPMRQWWPECLSVEQIGDVADCPIPEDTVTLDPTLSDLETFVREKDITVIIAHSQGGHVAGLLIKRMEDAGDCPITHVVLLSTYNSRWEGDCLQTKALVVHNKDDDVVPFQCRPTIRSEERTEWLWENGEELLEEKGGHCIVNRGSAWTRIAEFIRKD